MKRKILLWVTFTLTLCAVNAFGQTADLAGRVVDENGAGVAGANVVLKQQGINFERFAVTDQSGGFSFDRLPTGSFEINVTAKGFAAERQSVSTGNKIEITLHPERVAEYVAVTSSSLAGTSEALEQTAGSIQTIDKFQLEQSRVFNFSEVLWATTLPT